VIKILKWRWQVTYLNDKFSLDTATALNPGGTNRLQDNF